MAIRKNILIHNATVSFAARALTVLITAASLLPAYAAATKESGDDHSGHSQASSATLVQLVRQATQPFLNVNAATAAGYQPYLGCISGQDHGAMGVHYVNGNLVGDGELDASKPEVLVYEPSSKGLTLVAVEFVVIAADWLAHHSTPPVLEGQTFLLIDSPNRFGLPAHYELHVWAWRDNPNGAFVDWNNAVTCEEQ
jgi:hypothetical protein